MPFLEEIVGRSLERGWTSFRADIAMLLDEAAERGWVAVPIRKGEAAISTLRVVNADEAHPQSLSAMVGHGRQPLHTDGAHHRSMPDVVLLSAAAPSATPTLLCDPGTPTEAQRTGVFKVGDGRDAFYASAVDARGRWRFDPGCMKPMDELAQRALLEIDALSAGAIEHHWRDAHTVLAIANRRLLHGRAAATDPATRRVYRAALITRTEF